VFCKQKLSQIMCAGDFRATYVFSSLNGQCFQGHAVLHAESPSRTVENLGHTAIPKFVGHADRFFKEPIASFLRVNSSKFDKMVLSRS